MENASIQNVKTKKNIMFSLLIFVLAIAIAGIGGTLAFLTKNTEKRANNFTFGNVAIKLTEDKWEKLPPEDKIIYPDKSIPKDPVITNTGKNDAYVYMEVKVPRAEVGTYGENGISIKEKEERDLFTFVVEQDIGWVQLGDTAIDGNYSVYLYVYNEPLSPKDSTPPLFEEVKVIPMLEGELEMNTSIEIPITAYAMQSDFVEKYENEEDKLTKFKEAFEEYVKSES